MGDIRAEVPAHDAVPGGIVLLVHLLLDVGGNVLLYVVLFQGVGGTVHSVLDNRFIVKCQQRITVSTCCISSDMSAFLITAFLSLILATYNNLCKEVMHNKFGLSLASILLPVLTRLSLQARPRRSHGIDVSVCVMCIPPVRRSLEAPGIKVTLNKKSKKSTF